MNIEKKYAFPALIVLIGVTGVLFPHQVSSGYAFMTGDSALQVEESRFGSSSSAVGNYSEEIENLSRREYYITQENGTEPPFENEYYDNEREGIYIDVVSGEPLFSSEHKFDSGTGWPSFYRPLEPENIVERPDPGPLGDRVEVASADARSHLGHVFSHPNTPTGLRYCLNSAALEFIPADDLEQEGYGEYSKRFE